MNQTFASLFLETKTTFCPLISRHCGTLPVSLHVAVLATVTHKWLASRPMSHLIGLTFVKAPACCVSRHHHSKFYRNREDRDVYVKIFG